MRSKGMMGLNEFKPRNTKKTRQGHGKNSVPKRGKKAYRGQGR